MAAWRLDYNTIRPHSSLGNLPPIHYAKLSAPASQRDRTLRAIGGYAPAALPSRLRKNAVELTQPEGFRHFGTPAAVGKHVFAVFSAGATARLQ